MQMLVFKLFMLIICRDRWFCAHNQRSWTSRENHWSSLGPFEQDSN